MICVSLPDMADGGWPIFSTITGSKPEKENWHDASVGAILHNPLYKGILKSEETYAGPFEELQIIKPEMFDLAQKLMLERSMERKDERTVPLMFADRMPCP